MAAAGERKGGDHGGDRKSSSAMELEDLGVTKKQSHNWQKLAALSHCAIVTSPPVLSRISNPAL
jgi:hypothetical protein